ncbi:DUF6221 family protein [Streptomyces sp. NBC_01116]|uniref:DUF6221 family protein n=1 Tax=Streptomyces sp. NBC_01116 TaxID=2903752 RepID=UPI00324F7478
MDDLVQFLRNRLDEDEQAARAATWDEWDSAHWTARPPQGSYERYIVADHLDDGVVVVTPENADADGVGQHIARHDPARVLRDVEAKRMIVDAHGRGHECISLSGSGDKSVVDGKPWAHWEPEHTADAERPCFVLRAHALSHADHPNYKDEWRP